MNFFLVESPLQVLCATEARESFGDGLLIVKETGSERNNHQIKLLLERLGWKNVRVFTRGNSRKFGSIKLLSLLSRELKPGPESKIFLGDYRSKWMQLAANRFGERVYLLDDGLAMQEIVDGLHVGKKLTSQSFSNQILSLVLGLGVVRNRPQHVFSFLPIKAPAEKQKLDHSFEKLKAMLSKEAGLDSASACFIGSRYIENEIISAEDYKRLLEWTIERCNEVGQSLVYLPHRYESDVTLDLVKSLGVPVRFLDYPAEIGYLIGEISFSSVYGLYSTVLVSAGVLVEGLNVYSLKPSRDVFIGRQESVDKCYEIIEKLPSINLQKV